MRLVLDNGVSKSSLRCHRLGGLRGTGGAYVEMSPGWVLPVMSFSQASAHSWTTSMAYLEGHWLASGGTVRPSRPSKETHFLFLHSPVKANWFSGLPSGIL